jgi:phosphatidylserine/phosphatidylglycerophosphate/cardiolipin synthase-like enzyme
MGLARDLVELENKLPGQADPFAPIDRGGLLTTPECAAMVGRIGPMEPAAIMRLCLQALGIQRQELLPLLVSAELVATLPPEAPGLARPTERVIREMVERGSHEVILLGYELTDLSMITLLAAASRRGANVFFICDRGRRTATRVLNAWPPGIAMPRIFHDRERPDLAPYASMHAKCLLVDGNDLLVTSANFTFHGLFGNIEIGVRLGGAPAGEARKIFSYLVESRILEEVSC